MNHLKSSRKFGRTASHRRAMMRNMAASLIEHEQIKTTLIKAKELRGVVEPLITRSADNSLATRRYLIDRLRSKDAVNKLLDELGPRYQTRPGGYIRLLKCGHRAGDNAPMAIVQLVEAEYTGTSRQDLAEKAEADRQQAVADLIAAEKAAAEEVVAEEATQDEKATAAEADTADAAQEAEAPAAEESADVAEPAVAEATTESEEPESQAEDKPVEDAE